MKKLFLEHYKKLKKQEKILVVAFIAVVFFSIYFKFIYRPLSNATKSYRLESQKIGNQLKEMKAKLPKTDNRGEEIIALKNEKEAYSRELEKIKSKMPSRGNISGLIGEFSRQAKEIELTSIRQNIETSQERPHLYVEMKFKAPYRKALNYINRLESISQLLKITKAEFESLGKNSPRILSQMVFSLPLSNQSTNINFKAKETETLLPKNESIFTSGKAQIAQEKTKDFQLGGITFNSRKPTAIINGEVVGIGSMVEGFKVEEILPKSVILTDGSQKHRLTIKR